MEGEEGGAWGGGWGVELTVMLIQFSVSFLMFVANLHF